MRFLIDAQLPPALAVYLSRRGFPSEHVNRVKLGHASDVSIWSYAAREKAVLTTKDEDFVALARQRARGPQVVWIRLGNITNAALQAAIGPVLDEIVDGLNAGERLIEVK
jgi:predicted nuclease of predicted toxin-antitoxin system